MRTRAEIIRAVNESKSTVYDRECMLEVLLDIRELLLRR